MDIDPSCPMCGKPETVTHIFVECYLVKIFWKTINLDHQIDSLIHHSRTDWMVKCKNLKPNLNISLLSWKELFPFYLWNIWLTRNHNHHTDHKILIPISTPFERAIEYHYLTTGNRPAVCIPRRTWIPPIKGFKLNIDRAFNHVSKNGGAGGCIRDEWGRWVRGFSANLSVSTPYEAELCSLFYGLLLVRSMQVTRLEIATNSQEVINMLQSNNTPSISLVTSFRDLLRSQENPQMRHEHRQSNGVADRLAKEGLKSNLHLVLRSFWTMIPALHL